ncbi:uncharacterized protein LOC131876052 [Cryptomeria japonica]|uniref:uncharacterized protein LOC131876052 n=1 Tax=Cryptomeria japonica TaxID=3369 RepID=UPI0027DA351A|nr:uncharacterized protein LOC131876052 [Cryptomeria japonica]
MEILCEYDFEVRYIHGKENVVVDALRYRRHEVLLVVLNVDLRCRILSALPANAWYQEVREEISLRRPLDDRYMGYSLESNRFLRHLGRIYVPPSDGLRALILSEVHHAPYSAHPCVKKMHADLYHWTGMRRDIADYVSCCLECQQVKAEHRHPTSLLQLNLIPEWK